MRHGPDRDPHSPEGKTLEFKQDLPRPDVALKAIVVFANTQGRASLWVGSLPH